MALSDRERAVAAQENRLTQAEQARAEPTTGHPAPTNTQNPSSHAEMAGPMDSLDAYIEITDSQRRILDRDQQFMAFQRANSWGMYFPSGPQS